MTLPESQDRSSHWESVYTQKAPTAVSWYLPRLGTSLALLERAGLNAASRVIDVGGGASTLVDDLLGHQVAEITVLDLSAAALAVSQARLAARSGRVNWLIGDVTQVRFNGGAYTHWHDRAVMHFLIDEVDVQSYAGVEPT